MIMCSSCAASASSHHRCSRCATTTLGSVMHPLFDRSLDGDKLGFLPASSFVSVAPNLGRRGPSPRSAVWNQDKSPESAERRDADAASQKNPDAWSRYAT